MWYDTQHSPISIIGPGPTTHLHQSQSSSKLFWLMDCIWIEVEVVCIQFEYNWNQFNFQDSIFASLNWIIDFTNILIAWLYWCGYRSLPWKWCNITMAMACLSRGHPMNWKGSPLHSWQPSTVITVIRRPSTSSNISNSDIVYTASTLAPAIKNNNISCFQKPAVY